MKRRFNAGAVLTALLAVLALSYLFLSRRATVEAAGVQAPRFEVEPLWPKPLPNHWVLGNVIGLTVDSNDHIWIVHRAGSLERMETYAAATPPASDCCLP